MNGDRLLPPAPIVDFVGYQDRWQFDAVVPPSEGPPGTCSMPDCDKSARSCGWCYDHCNVIHRHERPACAVEGCERPHRARGLCKRHYERYRATGSPATRPKPKPSHSQIEAEMREALARLSGEVAG